MYYEVTKTDSTQVEDSHTIDLEKIKNNICKDKSFDMLATLRAKSVRVLKMHLPFYLYNYIDGTTFVVTNVYTEQIFIDDEPKPKKIKIEYLEWDIFKESWEEHTEMLDDFKLSYFKNAFPATEKQMTTISNDKVYHINPDQLCFVSGAEAYERIKSACKSYEHAEWSEYSDEYLSDIYFNMVTGPWGEGT